VSAEKKSAGEKWETDAEVTSKVLWEKEPRKYLMVFCAHQGSPWTNSFKKVDPGGSER